MALATGKETLYNGLLKYDLNQTIYGVQNLHTCIVGDNGVGKTTILTVLKSGAFVPIVPHVLEKFYIDIPTSKPGKIDCHMLVQDTDGEHSQIAERESIYKNSDVIIVCFAIDNVLSFNNVKNKWYEELQKFCPDKPFILLGNKCELRYKVKELEAKGLRLVSELEALELCHELGAYSYIESSTHLNSTESVKSPFLEAVAVSWPSIEYSVKNIKSHFCTIL